MAETVTQKEGKMVKVRLVVAHGSRKINEVELYEVDNGSHNYLKETGEYLDFLYRHVPYGVVERIKQGLNHDPRFK